MKTIQFIQLFAFALTFLSGTFTSAQNVFPESGKVGIGISNPTVYLDILSSEHSNADIVVSSPNHDTYLKLLTQRNNLNTNLHSKSEGNEGWAFAAYSKKRTQSYAGDLNINYRDNNGWKTHLSIDHKTGNVGIGTRHPRTGFKLAVAGKVICEELKVQLANEWPDYVFRADYQLPSLEEVETSININGHLPGIPSAANIEAEGGIEVGEMQRLMMQKIEELTLYVIDLKKEDGLLRAENERLKAELEAMKTNCIK